MRKTRQQQAIADALERTGRPMSPAELHKAASADVPSLGVATVYRAIGRMVESGEIVPVELPGQPDRYETKAAADRHHHHFHCTVCDRVFDVQGCVPGVEGLAPEGFAVRGHEIMLHGVCAECGAQHAAGDN